MIHNPILIIVAGLTCGATRGTTPKEARAMRQHRPDLRRIAPTNGRRDSAAGQGAGNTHVRPARLPHGSIYPTGRTPAPMLSWAGSAYAHPMFAASSFATRLSDARVPKRSREHIANVREPFASSAGFVRPGGGR